MSFNKFFKRRSDYRFKIKYFESYLPIKTGGVNKLLLTVYINIKI